MFPFFRDPKFFKFCPSSREFKLRHCLHLPRLLQAKTLNKNHRRRRRRERAKACLNVRTTSISFFLFKTGFWKPLLVLLSIHQVLEIGKEQMVDLLRKIINEQKLRFNFQLRTQRKRWLSTFKFNLKSYF